MSNGWSTLAFDALALFGRAFLERAPPDVPGPEGRLLNLGCGSDVREGWVNADFFRWQFWRVPRGYWMVDLRRPLPCADDFFDGVFCEHVLEHLAPAEARVLLGEIRRVLRPGALLRLSVPDLAKYVARYRGEASDPEFGQWPDGASALHSLTQGFGHRSIWDAAALEQALRAAGLTDVRRTGFREGSDSRLLGDQDVRRWESAYLEARKPSGGPR